MVTEQTTLAWFPIAVFCQRQGVKVYLVNSQQVADLRRYYRKHAKSDRIDSRVLAKLPIASPEKLHPLQLIGASQLACQRGCKELDRLMDMSIAIQNRLRAIDRFAWPGLEHVPPDYAYLQVEVTREQVLLSMLEAEYKQLQLETVRPLYRQLHPSRNLESLYGVGQDGAAVYSSFIGDPKRFPDHSSFRGWSGMIPRSSQSGTSEAKGLPISQAGPDLIKKFSFLGAETARQWDPQIAAIYYDQIVQQWQASHASRLCVCHSSARSHLDHPQRRPRLRTARCGRHSGECRASSKNNRHPLQCAQRSSAA
jgi:Transposase/Transposase IS116/IS110/IS902 family